MKNSAVRKTEDRKPFCIMKRGLLSAVCFIALSCACFAQDIIVTRDSKRIEAKVTEVNVDNVKYKIFDYQDGPVYTLQKSDIVTILYQNGLVETFASESSTPAQTPAQTVAPAQTAATTQTPAQKAPATVQTSGSVLSTADLKQRMAVNAPHLYDRYKSASTLSGVGAGLTLGGVAVSVIGFAAADKDTVKEGGVTTTYLSGPGAGLFAAGIVCSLVGTPLWIVGGVKKKRTRNAYLQEFGYSFHTPVQPSPYLQFNATPNGLGVAFVF